MTTIRGMRTSWRWLAAVTAALVLSLPTGAVFAASAQGQLVISDTTPSPGDESGTVIQGTEYAPDTTVEVLFNGQRFKQATADSGGTFAVEFFPDRSQCGQTIEVAATGEGRDRNDLRKTGTLTVTCEQTGGSGQPSGSGGTTTPAQELPLTGPEEVLPYAAAGVVVIAVGVSLVLAGRCRDASS